MKMTFALFVVVVILSGLEHFSSAFDDLYRNNGVNERLDVKNLKNVDRDKKLDLSKLVMKSVRSTEGTENKEVKRITPRSRKRRCTNPRVSRRFRRPTTMKSPAEYISISRSVLIEKSFETSSPRQYFDETSPENVRKSRTAKFQAEENDDDKIVPQQVFKDSINNENHKKDCGCDDISEVSKAIFKKPFTPYATKNKRRLKTSAEIEVEKKSEQVQSIQKQDENECENCSPDVTVVKLPRSKRLRTNTDVSQPQPCQINNNQMPPKSKWPFVRTISNKDSKSNKNSQYLKKQFNSYPRTKYSKLTYAKSYPGKYYSSERIDDQTLPRFFESPRQEVTRPAVARMDECVELYGIENCIARQRSFDDQMRSGYDYITDESSRNFPLNWKYPNLRGKGKIRESLEIIEGESFDPTPSGYTEVPADQQGITFVSYTSGHTSTEPFLIDHVSSTPSIVGATAGQESGHRVENEEFDPSERKISNVNMQNNLPPESKILDSSEKPEKLRDSNFDKKIETLKKSPGIVVKPKITPAHKLDHRIDQSKSKFKVSEELKTPSKIKSTSKESSEIVTGPKIQTVHECNDRISKLKPERSKLPGIPKILTEPEIIPKDSFGIVERPKIQAAHQINDQINKSEIRKLQAPELSTIPTEIGVSKESSEIVAKPTIQVANQSNGQINHTQLEVPQALKIPTEVENAPESSTAVVAEPEIQATHQLDDRINKSEPKPFGLPEESKTFTKPQSISQEFFSITEKPEIQTPHQSDSQIIKSHNQPELSSKSVIATKIKSILKEPPAIFKKPKNQVVSKLKNHINESDIEPIGIIEKSKFSKKMDIVPKESPRILEEPNTQAAHQVQNYRVLPVNTSSENDDSKKKESEHSHEINSDKNAEDTKTTKTETEDFSPEYADEDESQIERKELDKQTTSTNTNERTENGILAKAVINKEKYAKKSSSKVPISNDKRKEKLSRMRNLLKNILQNSSKNNSKESKKGGRTSNFEAPLLGQAKDSSINNNNKAKKLVSSNELPSKKKEEINGNPEQEDEDIYGVSDEDITEQNNKTNPDEKSEYTSEEINDPNNRYTENSSENGIKKNDTKPMKSDKRKGKLPERLAIFDKILTIPEFRAMILDFMKDSLGHIDTMAHTGLEMIEKTDESTQYLLQDLLRTLSLTVEPALLSTSSIPNNVGARSRGGMEVLKDYVEALLNNNGLSPGVLSKSPILQNIIARTVKNSLKNANKNVMNSDIWKSIDELISQAGGSPNMDSPELGSPADEQVSEIHKGDNSDAKTQKPPQTPVREQAFAKERLISKNPIVGNKRNFTDEEKLNGINTLGEPAPSIEYFDSEYPTDWNYATNLIPTNLQEKSTDSKEFLKNYVETLFEKNGLNPDELSQSPIMQSIIATTLQNSLRNANKNFMNSDVWDIIDDMSQPAEFPSLDNSPDNGSPADEEVSKIHENNNSNAETKKLGKIPVWERAFVNGRWIDKNTFLGNKRNLTNQAEWKETKKFQEPALGAIIFDFENSTDLNDTKNVLGAAKAVNLDDSKIQEDEKAPIEYYSPRDRLLAYRKKFQNAENIVKHVQDARPNIKETKNQENSTEQSIPLPQKIETEIVSLTSTNQSNHENYDPTYFGKIISEPDSRRNRMDLINNEVFYIGDGVKIPLKMSKMPDGSWRLSLSDKFYKNLPKEKCTCCGSKDSDGTSNSNTDEIKGRYIRSTSERNNKSSQDLFEDEKAKITIKINNSVNLTNFDNPINSKNRDSILEVIGESVQDILKQNLADVNAGEINTGDTLSKKQTNFDDEKFTDMQSKNRQYRYQRNMEYDAKDRMDTMKTLLYWVKEFFIITTAIEDP